MMFAQLKPTKYITEILKHNFKANQNLIEILAFGYEL